MDFTFSPEQDALRDAVRAFVTAEGSVGEGSAAPGKGSASQGTSTDVWPRMVDLGWTGVLVPETFGGLGLGLVDATVVLEEMGKAVFPGPYLASAVLATMLARRLSLDELVAGLGAGTTVGTIALDELGHGDPVERVRTRATRRKGRWVLNGHKPVVLAGHAADWVLVAARTEHGLGTFQVTSPEVEVVPTWDVSRQVTCLDLHDTPAEPVGPDTDHTAVWRRVAEDGAVALSAESLGAAESAFDAAVDYAKTRVQFDRPIATFQAIKHKAAEMLHRITLARVGVQYAAWASDADEPTRAEAAAMAKSYVSEAANEVCAEAIQIHGGVGFTWDCDAHRFYRRAKQNDLLLGRAGWHRARVADHFLATG